jgi:hypothetical protein
LDLNTAAPHRVAACASSCIALLGRPLVLPLNQAGSPLFDQRLTPFALGLDHRRREPVGYATLHLAGSNARPAILAVEVGMAFIQHIF